MYYYEYYVGVLLLFPVTGPTPTGRPQTWYGCAMSSTISITVRGAEKKAVPGRWVRLCKTSFGDTRWKNTTARLRLPTIIEALVTAKAPSA